MTPLEVAERLNIKVQTVLNYRKRGILPGLKLGYNLIRFDPRAVDRFLREHAEVAYGGD